MIPTAAVAKIGPQDRLDSKRPAILSHQSPDLTSKDPVMAKLHHNSRVVSLQNGPESTLLNTLSQFIGQIAVSPQQLLNAMENDPGFAAANASSSGFETMAWDEFDTQGNDMMQRVYEDRIKKTQLMDAKNNAPTMVPHRGPLGAQNSPQFAPNHQKPNPNPQNQQNPRGSALPQRGQMKELDLDSDDSDFGEQIKKQKTSQKKQQQQQQLPQPPRGVPIGGTLPPGMTILDLDSSDEEDFKPRGGRGLPQQQQQNQQQSQQNFKTPSIRALNGGPKVISMSYKADHATPLAQSMMGGGGGLGMGFGGAFDTMFDEVQEGDEEDEEDDDAKSVDSDFGPMNSTQRIVAARPPRPAVTPKNGNPSPPPPPPPLESPNSTNVAPRPQRPFGGNGTTATGIVPNKIDPIPPPVATTTVTTGRMSIWDRAKADANPSAIAGAKRMSLWDRAKNDTTTPATTTTTASNTTITAKTTAIVTPALPVAPKTPVVESTRLEIGIIEAVPASLPTSTSSNLFQQLNESGFLRNWNKNKPEKHRGFGGAGAAYVNGAGGDDKKSPNRVGPTKNIPIRFKFNTGLITLSIHPNATVEEFIQESLDVYQQMGKSPALQSMISKDYNLHMWDDDEEEIDDDIPPFNRSQVITQLDSTSLCIVPGPNIGKHKALSLELDDLPSRSALDDFDDSYGNDLFSPIAAVRPSGTPNNTAESSTPRPFGSQREPSLLDLASQPDALSAISAQFSEDSLTTLDSVSAYIHQLYSVMTPTTAGKPTQYKTFKINEKGKRQERYFGLDRYNIYNKTTPSSAFNTFSKLLNISKTERPIKSIIHVRVLPDSLTTFEIDYKEDNSDTVTTRGYDVESVMICAEIVAKLRYLINNP